MWLVGVVMYTLLGGYAPFERPLDKLNQFIIWGDYEFHNKYWADMISFSILQVDHHSCATAKDALDYEWMVMDMEAFAFKDQLTTQNQMEQATTESKGNNRDQSTRNALQALIKINKWLLLGAIARDQAATDNTLVGFENRYDWGNQIRGAIFSVALNLWITRTGQASYGVKYIPQNGLWEKDAVALQVEISCFKLAVNCPWFYIHGASWNSEKGLFDKIIENEIFEEAEDLTVNTKVMKGREYCH